jgi:predicted adenylyl cyclase CyaB
MEVEVRAKLNSMKKMIEKIESLWIKLISKKNLEDSYWWDIGLYKKLGHSFWIRIRDKGNNDIEMAYKWPTEIDGVYDEHEFNISDKKEALLLCKKMWLSNPVVIKKIRLTYKYQDITICLDSIEDKWDFIELEIISNSSDKSKLYSFMKKLWISKDQIFDIGFITLFLSESDSVFKERIKN